MAGLLSKAVRSAVANAKTQSQTPRPVKDSGAAAAAANAVVNAATSTTPAAARQPSGKFATKASQRRHPATRHY